MGRARTALRVLAAVSFLVGAAPALAQMDRPDWIEDIKWRASLGTGVALETGGVQHHDPVLLYFGGNVRKSWRWWYGLTFEARGDFYTGLVDYPMTPYKLDGTAGLALGPEIFQMMLGWGRVRTEFGGIGDGYGTGTDFRLEASTLPTVRGAVPLDDRHTLTYYGAPLQIVVGDYAASELPGIDEYSWKPYTSGMIAVGDHFVVNDWFELLGNVSLLKAWSNQELRFIVDLGARLAILDGAVKFGLDVQNETWKPPVGESVNLSTFTLSARLQI